MSNKFSWPKRYDKEEAKSGVWFEVYNELDQYYGSYRLALFNASAKHVIVEIDRWNRKNQELIKSRKIKGDHGLIKAFVDIALLDWKDVPLGPDGKDLPFSKETAFELLTDAEDEDSFLATSLVKLAGDVTNFAGSIVKNDDDEEVIEAGDIEAEQEEDAKN